VAPHDKANILVIDDKPAKRLALVSVLEELQQNVVVAESGRDALRLLLNHEYAVILLDVQMPEMDGFQTAELIRSRKQSEYTPIIFVTAYTRAETDMTRGYSLGAVDFIFTPIIPEILRAKVAVFVELHFKSQAIKAHEQRLREMEAAEHRMRLSEAAQRLELETQRNRFFTLSVELLAIASFDGYFKQLNPTWSRTLGYSDEELVSRPVLDFIHPDDREAARAEWQVRMREPTTGLIEHRCLCKDSGYRWLSWSTTAFPAEGLIYIFARDVTQRKDFELALQDKNRSLEIANAELEAFSYSVSHDLRTPLRHIDGISMMLLEDCADALDSQGKEHIARLRGAAERMSHLIDDMLHLSRVIRTELTLQETDLGGMVLAVATELRRQQPDHFVELAVNIPGKVRCDPRLMRIACENLLGNAWKFTGKRAHPRVEVGAKKKNGEAVYFVRDNGVGFDMKYAQRLFGVFQRLHSDTEFPGTGIGLATVDRIVRRHGGRLWAEAAPGEGAVFYFTL
jgi:PAS domain S-box-containing protein